MIPTGTKDGSGVHLEVDGVRISIGGSQADVATFGEMLGRPRAAAPGAGHGPALRIDIRSTADHPRPAGEAAFRQGFIECFVEGDALVVWMARSRATVRGGGAEVLVEIGTNPREAGPHLFVPALVLALRWHGLFHLHAGAVVAPDGRGILIPGNSGAGKSTLVIALVEAGSGYMGDDGAFLSARNGGGSVVGMPRLFHVAPRTAAAFPRIASLLGKRLEGADKRRLEPGTAWPGRERRSMERPAALLLPRLTGEAVTVVERASCAEAMGVLVEASPLALEPRLPGAERHLEVIRGLAEETPAWHVGLGRDLLESPRRTVERILRETGSDAARAPGQASTGTRIAQG